MSKNVKYTAKARAAGGRDGHVKSFDGVVDLKLTIPKELGGAGGDGANPEQLLACGYAAAFLGAMQFVSSSQGGPKIPPGVSVTSAVGIGPHWGTVFGLTVNLEVDLPGMIYSEAQRLVNDAFRVCPYSKAFGNVGLSVKV